MSLRSKRITPKWKSNQLIECRRKKKVVINRRSLQIKKTMCRINIPSYLCPTQLDFLVDPYHLNFYIDIFNHIPNQNANLMICVGTKTNSG